MEDRTKRNECYLPRDDKNKIRIKKYFWRCFMKKILILAMMTLLFAVIALSTTGNFFWVTSTFGTPTSLFGGSGGGNGGPNPNVNPPFPPSSGDPTDWAVFATEGKYSLTGGAFIKPKNEISPSGYIGTNASSLVEGIHPFDFGGSED